MSRVALWWLTVNGPQNAAQASPLSTYELAKNRLLSAENPRPTWQASPTKQLLSRAPPTTDAPACTTVLSHSTPLPMYMLASGVPLRVQSQRRSAPLISHSSPMHEFTISRVLTIFTP